MGLDYIDFYTKNNNINFKVNFISFLAKEDTKFKSLMECVWEFS